MKEAHAEEAAGELAALRAELERDSERIDYWYQTAQALVVRLVRSHLPYDTVERLLFQVESDAATGFGVLSESGVAPVICLRMFEGLRTLIDEQMERRRREQEGA